MIGFVTVKQGKRVAVWNIQGEARFVDGPKRLFLFGERLESLGRFRAEPHQYLVIPRSRRRGSPT